MIVAAALSLSLFSAFRNRPGPPFSTTNRDDVRSQANADAPNAAAGAPVAKFVVKPKSEIKPTFEKPTLALAAPFDASAAKQAQKTWSDYLKMPVEMTNSIDMKLSLIPPGHFTMGSLEAAREGNEDETSVPVTLTNPFWLGSHEVTRGQWRRVMRMTPWNGAGARAAEDAYPATDVTWFDSVAFCEELTRLENRGAQLPVGWKYALPTEAQWEYACRAGTTTQFSFGDDAALLPEYASFDKNARGSGERSVQRVGLRKPNCWGLYDMHGNVWEWCRDCYAEKLPGGNNPEVCAGPSRRIYRGGSWSVAATLCRSAHRDAEAPGFRFNDLGFRVAVVPASE